MFSNELWLVISPECAVFLKNLRFTVKYLPRFLNNFVTNLSPRTSVREKRMKYHGLGAKTEKKNLRNPPK